MFKRRIYRLGRCEWCEQETPQQRKTPDHLVHGVLTLLTGGLWAVSWASMCLVMRAEVWRCARCRAPQTLHLPVRPGVTVVPEPPVSVIRTDRLEKVA